MSVAALAAGAAVLAAWTAGGSVPAHPRAAKQGVTSIPMAARGPVSTAIGSHRSGYRVANLHARNRPHHLGASFSLHGATIVSGSAAGRLGFVAYGHEGALRHVAPVKPQTNANRVTYAHEGVREWWTNGPLGLEQGFDVQTRPSGGHGPLTLSLAVSGDLRVRATRSGVSLEGRGESLRYGDLSASDAQGRTLPSRLEVHSGQLQIKVDDRNAAYPIRVDPFVQQAKLTASDGAANDLLGTGLAVSGDTIAVGAGFDDVSADADRGAVYVFEKPASGWANATQSAILTASDGAANDGLNAVSISGDTIVAGAGHHKVGANVSQGAVYVFVKPAGGWHDAN